VPPIATPGTHQRGVGHGLDVLHRCPRYTACRNRSVGPWFPVGAVLANFGQAQQLGDVGALVFCDCQAWQTQTITHRQRTGVYQLGVHHLPATHWHWPSAHPNLRTLAERSHGTLVWNLEAATAPTRHPQQSRTATRFGRVLPVLQPCPATSEPGWIDTGREMERIQPNRLSADAAQTGDPGPGAGRFAGGVLDAKVARPVLAAAISATGATAT